MSLIGKGLHCTDSSDGIVIRWLMSLDRTVGLSDELLCICCPYVAQPGCVRFNH
jgi:hypothetical protein